VFIFTLLKVPQVFLRQKNYYTLNNRRRNMKTFFTLALFCLFLTNSIQAQTFAEPPGPENVLVVYRNGHTYSGLIKDHYVDVREIPSTHVTFVTLNETIQYGVEIVDNDERIVGEGILPWIYVKVKIADPIEDHLNTTYYNGQLLKDIIRYIVLCKGIPHRIDDTDCDDLHEHWRGDVTVDALLCLINQGNGNDFLSLYGSAPSPISNASNPYFYLDPSNTLQYRFISNFFQKDGIMPQLAGINAKPVENHRPEEG
jgi:hypothetical protein